MVGAGSLGICRECRESLAPWDGAACRGCGLPFASDRTLDSSLRLCARCRRQDYEFDLARSYGLYSGRLREAILLLKFGGRERLGGMLGGLLARLWNSDEELQAISDSVIVPVPLDRSRERERGFNQATLLVRGLSGRLRKDGAGLGIRVSLGCLIRTRATVPQTGLSLPARLENVRGAFAVESENQIRGRVAVVVDDVMTTGATLSACAGALKRAGAGRAIGLTLARSTPQFPDVPGPNRPVDEAARKSA